MNINFRTQPDPLMSPRGSTKPGPNERNMSLKHNNFLPRTVGHAKGLKDIPGCAESESGYISGHFIMPGIEQGQNQMRTRTSVGYTFPGSSALHLQSLTSKKTSLAQAIPYDMKEDIALLTNKTWNAPFLKGKSDLLRKYIPEQSQDVPVPEVRAISPALALRYRPETMEKMNYSSTYLDHEIKILEKLRDILQTDSVKEIKDWLSKASLKEKELVSNFIRSDITTRDLLNYQQKYVQSGSEAAHLNFQAMLKGPKAIGSIEEEKLLRLLPLRAIRGQMQTESVLTVSGATWRGPFRGNANQCQFIKGLIDYCLLEGENRESDHLLTGREKIGIPTSDPLPLELSPSRSKIEERTQTSPSIPQSSIHLLYNRCRVKRPQRIPQENILPKKL
uniref:uncharacterized protein C4orf17 homolog n=1 Tax=Euleptes europaea TaxID=460621 RepID=UPI002540EB38|nr:uncharacterized protein C4orf17 homolog [Euleptes europaea]